MMEWHPWYTLFDLSEKTLPKFSHFLLYVWKDSIMVSEQTMLFSLIELSLFFWGFSHLNNEMTNNLNVRECVIVSFCDSVTVLCV